MTIAAIAIAVAVVAFIVAICSLKDGPNPPCDQ